MFDPTSTDFFDRYPEEFYQSFVVISPLPEQEHLMGPFRTLCSTVQPAVVGYTVEAGAMSEAAWEYLKAHNIAHELVMAARNAEDVHQ